MSLKNKLLFYLSYLTLTLWHVYTVSVLNRYACLTFFFIKWKIQQIAKFIMFRGAINNFMLIEILVSRFLTISFTNEAYKYILPANKNRYKARHRIIFPPFFCLFYLLYSMSCSPLLLISFSKWLYIIILEVSLDLILKSFSNLRVTSNNLTSYQRNTISHFSINSIPGVLCYRAFFAM